MTKSIAFVFTASLLFITTACDPADEPTTERAAEIDADAEVEDPADGHHGGKRGDHAKFAVEKLCSELECSEAQATQIAQLLERKHDRRDKHEDRPDRDARKAAREQANKLLADAFRAEVFDVSALDRAKPERPDHDADHLDRMLTTVTELHAILTPEQRAKLADKLQADGPMFFIGKHGPRMHGIHGKHGDAPHAEGHPDKDPSERVAEHVQHLCEKVTCTADQQAQLTQLFAAEHEARHADKQTREAPDFSAVAELFRADTLDSAKLAETMAASKAEHAQRKVEHEKAFGQHLAQVHAILTPEQRAIVADLIEDKGLHALIGGKHGKRDKHGKHGKRDKD